MRLRIHFDHKFGRSPHDQAYRLRAPSGCDEGHSLYWYDAVYYHLVFLPRSWLDLSVFLMLAHFLKSENTIVGHKFFIKLINAQLRDKVVRRSLPTFRCAIGFCVVLISVGDFVKSSIRNNRHFFFLAFIVSVISVDYCLVLYFCFFELAVRLDNQLDACGTSRSWLCSFWIMRGYVHMHCSGARSLGVTFIIAQSDVLRRFSSELTGDFIH